MNAIEALKAAKAKLSQRGAWGKHYLATTKDGRVVPETHPDAACFCTLGALNAVVEDDTSAYRYLRLAYGPERTLHVAIPDWNDMASRRKKDVLDLYDRAIQLAERDAQEAAR